MDQVLREFLDESDSGTLGVPYSDHFPGDSAHDYHLVLGFIVHGNEWGTLPAALRLARALRSGEIRSGGPITLLFGNPEATRRNQRFVDEDLNRIFSFDKPAVNLERTRALEIRPLLEIADFFLDFHQTQTPTESPFWTFPWDEQFADWARIISVAPLALTRAPGKTFSKGTCCLDEYVRHRGKVGITAELGTKGRDNRQADSIYQGVRRLIAAIDEIQSGTSGLQALAAKATPIEWFHTAQVVAPESSAHRLRAGLGNWTVVEKDEILSPEGAPKIRAQEKGRILFPKYPNAIDPPPQELFRLGVRIEDPAQYFRAAKP